MDVDAGPAPSFGRRNRFAWAILPCKLPLIFCSASAKSQSEALDSRFLIICGTCPHVNKPVEPAIDLHHPVPFRPLPNHCTFPVETIKRIRRMSFAWAQDEVAMGQA